MLSKSNNIEENTNQKNNQDNENIVNNVSIVNDVNIVYFVTTLIAILGFNIILWVVSSTAYGLQIFGINYKSVTEKCIAILSDKMVAMVLSQLLIAAPMLIYILRKKIIKDKLGFNKINIVTLFGLMVFTYCMIPVMSFINMFSMMFVKNQISSTIYEISDKYPIMISIIVVAVMPAFVEELLFRGLLYNAHRKIDIKWACIINGLLFGLLHGNFNQFAYAFIMGWVFAMVVECTGSVLSTIWCHFIINANSIILAYVGELINESNPIVDKITYSWKEVICWGIFSVIPLCFAILIIIFLTKYNKRYEVLKRRLFKDTKKMNKKVKEQTILYKENIHTREGASSKIKGMCSFSLVFSIIISIIYMVCIEILC